MYPRLSRNRLRAKGARTGSLTILRFWVSSIISRMMLSRLRSHRKGQRRKEGFRMNPKSGRNQPMFSPLFRPFITRTPLQLSWTSKWPKGPKRSNLSPPMLSSRSKPKPLTTNTSKPKKNSSFHSLPRPAKSSKSTSNSLPTSSSKRPTSPSSKSSTAKSKRFPPKTSTK
jgi:hypothetical protein